MKPNRETPFERTMTANLGLALDDMAVASIIFRKAVKKGLVFFDIYPYPV